MKSAFEFSTFCPICTVNAAVFNILKGHYFATAPFFSTGYFAIVENFVLGDEHQYRDAERTGFGCRDGQPDALDAQNHGQEDEGQQLEQ